MITTFASANVHTQSNALEDRHSIQTLVDVNAQTQGLNVLVIKNTMMLLADALVGIDHQDVRTIKHLTMILADVNVLPQSNAQVDNHLTQKPADVSVLNLDLSALMLRIMTILHAGVLVRIDQVHAPTIKHMIMTDANVDAHTQSDAQEGRDLIQIPADASALSQDLSVHHLKNTIL